MGLHLKTRLDSPASALTRSLGLKCKDCRVCERPRAHEGGRGPLWITTVFWSRVEHSSEWIRGAHKTRQGKAMQPVKSCHLPATMGSCVKRGTGVAAGSCHVYFLDLATHFSKIEKNHFFSLEWARKQFPVAGVGFWGNIPSQLRHDLLWLDGLRLSCRALVVLFLREGAGTDNIVLK